MKETTKKVLSAIFEDFNDADFAELKTIVESFKKNEEQQKIDINREQVIEITPEMKEKYPLLKNYNEILIAGKKMNWWDADRYAYEHDTSLPNRDELKDIWKIIDNPELHRAWTREVDGSNSFDAYYMYPDGLNATYYKKTSFCVFCVR